MKRLSIATLADLPPSVAAPRERGPIATGIVHFGPGAFHRAHQAAFTDRLLDSDPRWGIAAVSLRSGTTTQALAEQDGLYTLAIRDAEPSWRVIGAHTRFLGPDDADATRALLADPAVALVTTTVTEKGYCLVPGGALDLAHPDIVHDLGGADVPRSVIGWIVRGLADRRAAGVAPYTVMPCDNLASNGATIRAALIAYARGVDPALAEWIESHVRVPATMVDSITPAADAAFLADTAAVLELDDRAAVQREAFAQWVIEDVGPIGPDLTAAGAIVTRDVAGYERAKLRILNGAHSTLAYAGLLRGHTSVAEAMRDAELARFVEAMIRDEIAPTLTPVAGLDLDAYRAAVLARFRNPALVHRLDQIAQDGSQKLPYRLGDTLAAQRAAGRMPRAIVAALGCWVAFLMARTKSNTAIVDPAADALTEASRSDDAATVVTALIDRDLGLSRRWRDDGDLTAALTVAVTAVQRGDWRALFG